MRPLDQYLEGNCGTNTVGDSKITVLLCRIELISERRQIDVAAVETNLILHPRIVVLLSED